MLTEIGMYPVKSKGGIDVMSVNLLLENDTDPVFMAWSYFRQCGKTIL